ncbi:MAG: radical SAM protein, partial [Calditrichaeota bacterium]|nr:radical SAM protein [Calditrichota bacterium]
MKEVVLGNLVRALSPRRVHNVALAMGSYLASLASRRPVVWAEPAILMVEPTNRCNLRCPQCHTGSGRISRAYARLSTHHFRAIIDDLADSLVYLLLFNQGEPYLHPEFLDL